MRTYQSITVPMGGEAYLLFGPVSRGRVMAGGFGLGVPLGASTAFGVSFRGLVDAPGAVNAAAWGDGEVIGGTDPTVGDEITMPVNRQSYIPFDAQSDRLSYVIVRLRETQAVGNVVVCVGIQTGRGSESPAEDRSRTVNKF